MARWHGEDVERDHRDRRRVPPLGWWPSLACVAAPHRPVRQVNSPLQSALVPCRPLPVTLYNRADPSSTSLRPLDSEKVRQRLLNVCEPLSRHGICAGFVALGGCISEKPSPHKLLRLPVVPSSSVLASSP
jgi:hypothetical protein